MTGELIVSPADLRPGDLMIGPIGGAVGVGTRVGHLWLGKRFRVGKVSADHMAIVTGVDIVDGMTEIRMVEAMPSGARVWMGLASERWTTGHAYVRIPEDYPGQAADAAAVAMLMAEVEVPYSFASYLALAAWRRGLKVEALGEWIKRERIYLRRDGGLLPSTVQLPAEAICSVLADQAWTRVGKQVMTGVAPMAVVPGELAEQLLSMPGATWCLPSGSLAEARSWVV